MPYNGYTNYQTWVTALWIDNDEGASEAKEETLSTFFSDNPRDGYSLGDLANTIENFVESYMIPDDLPDRLPGLASDLFNSAWQAIDWYDLARTWATDWLESNPPEEEA